LDAEAEAAAARPSRTPTAGEARAWLESLPDLWAETSDVGRRAIAEAVFERIDVLGARDFTFALTAAAKARGWDAAFGPGVVRVKEGQSGRGERIRASQTQQSIRFLMVNATPQESHSAAEARSAWTPVGRRPRASWTSLPPTSRPRTGTDSLARCQTL
jgi:hypothetical protein